MLGGRENLKGVDIDSIKVGDRQRKSLGDMEGLCDSIRRLGLINPITIDSIGDIKSAPAVIPTNPARIPFKVIVKSGFFRKDQEAVIAPIAPALAAKDVVTNTKETNPGSAVRTDPPLKPNHPNQRRKTPITAKGIECPGIG